MESFITDGNFEGLRAFIARASAGSSNEGSILEGMLECQVRERAMQLAKEEVNMEAKIRKHLDFVADLYVIQKTTAITAIQDLMDVSPLTRCKIIFGIVEEMMSLFKQPPLQESSQFNVLRMCNDLLKRLSRTVETQFSGRILSFVSRFLPLTDKSGVNLAGQFNTQNVTKYETGDTEFTDLFATQDDSMETGEIEESKESLIVVDSGFYQTFWKLQAFFSNPNLCFNPKQFSIFQNALSEIVTILATHKLEKFHYDKNAKTSDEPKNLAALIQDTDRYFAKYLTSPKLLQLQLNDSQFRRNFIVQVLITIQYLTSDVKMNRIKNLDLSEDQVRVVLEYQDKCYKLLRDTHPKGSTFVDNIKAVLSREKEWSEWKNQGCYDMDRNVDKTGMLVYRKRPRTEFDPKAVDLGSPELNKLWSIEPDIKKACRDPARKFIPTVEQFIQDPLDELDPEQQVDDEYKSINNTAFQWRASRFLMTEAESFWSVKGEQNKDITDDIAPFMAKVICMAGGKMDYLAAAASANQYNSSESPKSPEAKVTTDALDQLAIVLSKSHKLDDLIETLQPEFVKVADQSELDSFKSLVVQFAESKQNSIPKMANALLAAQLISEDVTDALNSPAKNGMISNS